MNEKTAIVIRGGGHQGSVVLDHLKSQQRPSSSSSSSLEYNNKHFDWDNDCFVWDDSDDDNDVLHPLFRDVKRLRILSSGYNDDNSSSSILHDLKKYDVIKVFVAVGSGKIRQKLVASVRQIFSGSSSSSSSSSRSGCDDNDNHNNPNDDNRQRQQRLEFPSLVHRTAVVSSTATIGEGCFVGPFVTVNTCAIVGNFALINTNAIIEHDCILGDYVTMNPASVVLGAVNVASFSTIGSQATIRDHCSISASHTIVGMGATVVNNIDPPTLLGFWGGVPAKPIFQPAPAGGCCEGGPTTSVDNGNQKQQQQQRQPYNNCTTTSLSVRWCYRKPFSSQRFLQYLQPSLEEGHITNDGPLQNVLQSKVQSLVRSKNSVLFTSSGTAALHALCTGLAIKYSQQQQSADDDDDDDGSDNNNGQHHKKLRWVTQAFTFPSSMQGPLADARIADIDPEWYGPSRTYLESHLDDFDGIIVTNPFGLQANLLGYERWCLDNHKLLVLDNAASPIGFVEEEDDGDDDSSSQYRRSTCIHDIGDGAIVSFHETKPFGRGEGGAVFAGRDVLGFVHRAMNFGYDIPKQERIPDRACSNWRMSDIAAAAICDHVDFVISNRWEERLQELTKFAIMELESRNMELAIPIKFPTVLSCLFVRLPPGSTPQSTLKFLHSRNVEAKHYYEPLCGRKEAPNAWDLFDSTICLPLHLAISKEELKEVIRMISNGG